jgi:hypothetical protein
MRYLIQEQTMCTYSMIIEADSKEEAWEKVEGLMFSEGFCEEGINNSCSSSCEEISNPEDYTYPFLTKENVLKNQLV